MSLLNKFNKNMSQIHPSPIRGFDEEASKVDGIIKLTLGEPDFHTPEHVKQAAITAINHNVTTYAPTPGTLELRQAAANFVKTKYGQEYDPQDEIIATVGASESLSSALLAILNPGDKVIIPAPFFSMYQSIITIFGGIPVQLDTSSNDFVLSKEMLEEALDKHGSDVKAVLLNYPTNPTGITWTHKQAKEIADVLKNRDIFVISDEVYSELVYDGEHVSISEFLRPQTIVINGVSKSHAMTGWRLGLMFAPREIMAKLNVAHQQLVTTATSITQAAATEALKNGMNDAEEMRKEYRVRRDYVYERMTALGFNIVKPNGAFYIFAKIPKGFKQVSYDFCLDLARKGRVALIPGSAFCDGGEGYVRLSYAASMDALVEAMNRLETYINDNKPK